MLFAPLDGQGHKRSVIYHTARLSMLRDRMAKKFDQVDHSADEVERAAAALVDVTHGVAVEAFQDAVTSGSSAAFLHLEAGQTLGF